MATKTLTAREEAECRALVKKIAHHSVADIIEAIRQRTRITLTAEQVEAFRA